jgi:UDP-2,3-diacylglucosamine hydrolase
MATYFISDVHLGLGDRVTERAKEDRLLAFLRTILSSTDRLYIIGDLFDFWFEYRTVLPKGFHRTLSALQEFTEKGIPVHFMAGNHDFWVGSFLTAEIGLTLHRDPFEVTIDKKRIFFHHGDGLAQKDLGYRLIRPVLRNRVNIALYRWLHPDIGVPLARGSSRTSRAYTAAKHYGEEESMLKYAAAKIAEGIDIVIMGHRHKPHLEKIGKGMYVNLGDWITYNTYGKLTRGKMTLETWKRQ